jgi:chromosome segregation ATPase
MPERGDDLEARVSRLEGEVARLKEGVSVSRADAAATRVLAGGFDREISDVRTELRAHTQVLNALHETQIEQGRHLSQLDAKVDQALGMLSTGKAQIVALLSGPRDKDDRPDQDG